MNTKMPETHLFSRRYRSDIKNTRIRYLGCQQINTSMKCMDFETRSAIAKECIIRICAAAGIRSVDITKVPSDSRIAKMLSGQPNLSFAGSDVALEVTSNFLKLISITADAIIVIHQMPNISFACGGDSETLDFVAYVAKDDKFGRACFVLECKGGLAKEIISSIGQAFEIRFKEIFKRSQQSTSEAPIKSSLPNVIAEPVGEQDYYNDLPGKVPPELSLIEEEIEEQDDLPLLRPNPRRTFQKIHTSKSLEPSVNLIDLTDEQSKDETENSSGMSDDVRDPFDMKPFNSTLKELSNKSNLFLETNNNGHEENLEDQPWYHGPISRTDSEKLVVSDGDFLVRESQGSPGQYVLTGKEKDIVRHLLLMDDDGVTVKTKDKTFKSVVHLVAFYQGNNLPLILGDDPIFLRNPVKVTFTV